MTVSVLAQYLCHREQTQDLGSPYSSGCTFREHQGVIESLNVEFALYNSKNLCARTDPFFFPLFEVSPRAVTFQNKE